MAIGGGGGGGAKTDMTNTVLQVNYSIQRHIKQMKPTNFQRPLLSGVFHYSFLWPRSLLLAG